MQEKALETEPKVPPKVVGPGGGGLDRTDWKIIALVFAGALLLRLVYLLQYRACPYFTREAMDAGYHLDWARAFASGESFVRGPYFRAPLYPLFLGVLFTLLGNAFFAVRLAQMVLGSASCVLVYLVGRQLFGKAVSAVAAFACATYWTLIYFDGEFLDPVLAIFLNLLLLWSLFALHRNPAPWRAARSGLLLGLSAIARPNILLMAPFAAIWIWRAQPRTRANLARAVILLAAVAVPILPVTIRNKVTGKDTVLIASQGGLNFYIGNNAESPGIAAHLPGVEATIKGIYEESAALAEKEVGHPLKQSQVSQFYAGKAQDWILGHPGVAMGLMLRKLAYFWSHHEIADNRNFYFLIQRYAPLFRFLPLGFWIVGPLGLVGLAACWRRRCETFPLWGFALIYMISVVAFFVNARFRLPVVPVLVLLGSYGGFEAVRRWRASENRRRKLVPLAAALVVGVVLAIPAPKLALVAVERTEVEMVDLASTLHDLGRNEEAIHLLEEAQAKNPSFAKAPYSMGVTYQAMNKIDMAVASYRRALELEPENVSALNNLGRLLLDSRRAQEAIPYFQGAIRANARHATSRFNLGKAYASLQRFQEAVPAFEEGLRIDPSQAEILMQVAWLRATVDQPGVLDCEKARTAGEEAVRLTRRGLPQALYSLAAAYAACGDFGKAVATTEEAIGLLRARGAGAEARSMEQQRDLYRIGKPIRWSEISKAVTRTQPAPIPDTPGPGPAGRRP